MNERTTVAKLEDLGIEAETIEKENWLDCIAEGIDELPVTKRLIISLFYYSILIWVGSPSDPANTHKHK